MKLICMPSNVEEIKKSLDYCDGYLIGIDGLSVNINLCVDIGQIKDIQALIGERELFVSLNKNIHNEDLNKLQNVMNELDDCHIKGVFYYDVSIVNIYNKGAFNYELIWASEHATTNYNTINYWQKFGIKGCCVSGDITIEEVYEIRRNTTCCLFLPIFGYQPMFNSRRHIVKNYLDFFSLDDNSRINYMEKENKIYPIVDNKLGTTVYSNYILNGLCEFNDLKDNNIDYILFNGFNIPINTFITVLRLAKNINKDNCLRTFNEINQLLENCSLGFLYQETVARVKKNDKKD